LPVCGACWQVFAGPIKRCFMPILYSVIIPAYNEEKWLPETLAALSAAMAEINRPGEIIVVDNNSSDRTAEVARRHGARVIFEPLNQISRARNTGARAAEGRYLVFLDADTSPPKRLLEIALENLESGRCCGGGALVAAKERKPWLGRWVIRFWNRLALAFKLAAGCFVYCSRRSFEQVGGFSEKVYAGEEILFSRSMARWGRAVGMSFAVIKKPRVVTSLRKLKWFTPLQLMLMIFIVFCPLALRLRILCAYWYQRPDEK